MKAPPVPLVFFLLLMSCKGDPGPPGPAGPQGPAGPNGPTSFIWVTKPTQEATLFDFSNPNDPDTTVIIIDYSCQRSSGSETLRVRHNGQVVGLKQAPIRVDPVPGTKNLRISTLDSQGCLFRIWDPYTY